MNPYVIRPAAIEDVPLLEELIATSARGLCGSDYTEQQIEAALGSAWGVDSQLIRDGTYFVVLAGELVIACGGWSRRRTLFGADAQSGRDPAELVPGHDAAKVRAFFVAPQWARRGIGQALLQRCEDEARRHGFDKVELLATLPGVRLYRAHGYVGDDRVPYTLPGGVVIDFVPMGKTLA